MKKLLYCKQITKHFLFSFNFITIITFEIEKCNTESQNTILIEREQYLINVINNLQSKYMLLKNDKN